MRRIIRIVVVFCVFWNVIACGQVKKSRKQMKNRPIAQLYKNAKKLDYSSMPQYYIEGYQSGCYYEIYVNGIMVFSHFENIGLANHAVCINDLILKSGSQKVTVKLYPLGEIDEENYPTLTSRSRFDLTIFKRDKTTPWEGLDYEVVKKYFAPTTSGISHGPFKHEGLPYFEETFTFNAEVPYELEGWSNSQNLKEMDQEQLEKEILAFYESYANIIYKQDETTWVEMVKKREKEYFKSVYYNDKKSKELDARIKEFSIPFDSEFKEKFPLEKYEILFGGGGKVVFMKSIESLGYSPFYFGAEENVDGEKLKFMTYTLLTFHKPQGSNKLEIIR